MSSWSWTAITMAPTGMGKWGDRMLRTKRHLIDGTCNGCAATNVPVFTAGKLFTGENYCVSCWNRFMLERGTDSLYNVWEAKKAKQEETHMETELEPSSAA